MKFIFLFIGCLTYIDQSRAEPQIHRYVIVERRKYPELLCDGAISQKGNIPQGKVPSIAVYL